MDNALKWYAVYTCSRFEKKTAERLTEQGIEAYVPLQRVMRQWSDRQTGARTGHPFYVLYINHRLDYKVLETPGIVRYVFRQQARRGAR